MLQPSKLQLIINLTLIFYRIINYYYLKEKKFMMY